MSKKVAEEFICDSCGAEYTITYDGDDILEDANFCPFCGNELDTYDIDEEYQKELGELISNSFFNFPFFRNLFNKFVYSFIIYTF